MAQGPDGDRTVTWEAADRGARCTLGCTALLLALLGVALAIWGGVRGAWWMALLAGLCVLGAVGLLSFLRSRALGRWEISFERERRVVRLYARERGEERVREFAFAEIAAIELERISRDVSAGEGVPYLLPVFRLKSGETVRLDTRMSIRDPKRAEEVVTQMRALVGLSGRTGAKG
ncbi:MAG: hypothetical protein AB7Y46_02440 [Armatimonadota bacterium]